VFIANLFLSIVGAACTLAIFTAVSVHFNEYGALKLLGTWNTLIYGGFAVAAICMRKSVNSQWALFFVLLFVGGLSNLYLLHLQLPYLRSPPGVVQNCAGPILELAVPLLQWPALGMAVLFGRLTSEPPSELPTA